MEIQAKINKYTDIIWGEQLPKEEESFLYDLLEERETRAFCGDPDADYALFLAYNAQKHGFEGYDERQVETFSNILRIYRLQKLRKIPAISKVLKVFNENGIEPVMIKGAAFLCHYSPDLPRMMDDIDICVLPDRFDKAVSLLYDLGFKYETDTGFHIGVSSNDLDIDVHRCIYKNDGDKGSDIYDRLIPCTFLGSKVYVLSPEDMLVHQLANRGRDICTQSHLKRHLKWIVDCHAIMRSFAPDPDSVLNKAKALNNLYYTELTLSKLIWLFPDRFERHGTRVEDRKYARFLKLTAKRLKNTEAEQTDGTRGLKYIYRVFRVRWKDAKVEKLATESKRSVLRIMLGSNRIFTMKDLGFRLKRFVRHSHGGGGEG